MNNNSKIYVNIPGIKMAKFPDTFIHIDLKDGDKVLCSIFNTFNYTDKQTNNIVGIGANLTFKSIISKKI